MFISKKIDDKEVLSSYINGYESALNVLIDRHRSIIFGFIISKVKVLFSKIMTFDFKIIFTNMLFF